VIGEQDTKLTFITALIVDRPTHSGGVPGAILGMHPCAKIVISERSIRSEPKKVATVLGNPEFVSHKIQFPDPEMGDLGRECDPFFDLV
jgi:hypothetical protein